MFEHLTYCHGEWTFLLTFIDSWPLFGAWLRAYFGEMEDDESG